MEIFLGCLILGMALGTLLAPDVGEVLLLRYMLNHTAATNVQLRLYTNNHTPVEGDTLALNYTESTMAGYTAVGLTGAQWTVATLANVTTAAYAEQTFSYTTSESCYGYFVTNAYGSGSNQVLWAERFTGAPFSLPAMGGQISITPRVVLD